MVGTPDGRGAVPLPEKLTLLWHNHFATSASKVRSAAELAAQNDTLRRSRAAGDFGTLAYGMLTDPAMLRWLDGIANTAKAPNENLSREFMELFALGHGNGYSESDVRAGARALTGWTITADGSARLDRGNGRGDRLENATRRGQVRSAPANSVPRYWPGPESARYVGGPHVAAAGRWRRPPSAAALDRLDDRLRDRAAISPRWWSLFSPMPNSPAAAALWCREPVEWLIGAVRALAVATRYRRERRPR